MNNIFYHFRGEREVGVYTGRSKRINGKVVKDLQIYLGRVVDKAKMLFWTRKRGVYRFDPDTQSFCDPDEESVPPAFEQLDGAKCSAPVMVDFGDSFFLDSLLTGIEYKDVLKCLPYGNFDSLVALLAYYVLDGGAAMHAESWLRQNYASYLYPHAHLAGQRISEILSALGQSKSRREFLFRHIEYVREVSSDDLCVLIDSTGLPNKCDLPVTRLNVHNGEQNVECRFIAVVQRSTGLPLYYEVIEGNIVDISTLDRITDTLEQLGCKVTYLIGDAGYCCPSTMERLVQSGIEFMSRLNPAYNLFKNIVRENLKQQKQLVKFKDRWLKIMKLPTVVGHDKDTGKECPGWIFLCQDMQSHHSKSDHILSRSKCNLSDEEIVALIERTGVFAIVTTRDLTCEEVLPEYYVRQAVEQYFDFGKNYAGFLPIRQHNMETLQGHMLLSFIATFIVVLIKNRLGTVDGPWVATIPAKDRSDAALVQSLSTQTENAENRNGILCEQVPLKEVFKLSPATLFRELRGQKADVYSGCLIPTCPVRQAVDLYEAFSLKSPRMVKRHGVELKPVYKKDQPSLTKAKAFAWKVYPTEQDIKDAQQRKQGLKAKPAAPAEPTTAPTEKTPPTRKRSAASKKDTPVGGTVQGPKRGRGRPKGSKNKKTLEKERLIAEGKITLPPKRPRGRPRKLTS